ncbi:MAG: group II intron reverse transcriptase/maturase [Acidobacteriota bacterium]|nr:group II intron reverse transcriptase/maturase [Acidobacteriota bacterium]
MSGSYSPGSISTRLAQIADLAGRSPEMVITTLAHHIDLAWMYEAYTRTRKSGATGVDWVTAEEYRKDLRANLTSLLSRFKSGEYKAPPVRRVYIPKAGGKTRPIGIPTFEDKVLQRAVAMVLEAVYEQDFLDCSYGFRPGRSAHQLLEDLWQRLMKMGGGWVLDVDVQSFFDDLDKGHLRGFLDKRVRDGVIRRAIDKWLKAGVLEDDEVLRPDTGTPQGGVISPLLANVYLHEVIDTWFEREVKPRMRGQCFLMRFADDMIMVFKSERDARRVLSVLPKRLAKYGLTMHPEKTRLVRFERPIRKPSGKKPGRGIRPGTFDFLGFTHYWGVTRRGNWAVQRKTAASRFKRAVATIDEWCQRHRHLRVKRQHAALSKKLTGHCAYYGITGNSWSLQRFRTAMQRSWRRWLNRRSQRARMTWTRFNRLQRTYPLPTAIAVHSVCRP